MSEEYRTLPELSEATSVEGTDLAYTVVAPGSGGQDRKVTWFTVGQYLKQFIVKGDKGDKGDAATIAVEATNTLPPGSAATVTNLGTSGDAVLEFGIPEGIQGIQGIQGEKGEKGDTAPLPAGGTVGQVVAKASADDFDVEYKTLTAADVGAYPDTNPSGFIDAAGAPVQSVNTFTGSVTLTATDVGAYPDTNPSGFISSASVATLTDVDVTSLSDGDLLTFGPVSGNWEPLPRSTFASPGDVLALVIALGG